MISERNITTQIKIKIRSLNYRGLCLYARKQIRSDTGQSVVIKTPQTNQSYIIFFLPYIIIYIIILLPTAKKIKNKNYNYSGLFESYFFQTMVKALLPKPT